VTEGNTYVASAPSTASRVIVPNNPYPYVSGPEYTYWPNTVDYVDGYRDGYAWGRSDSRYDCDRFSGSRYRSCRDRYADRHLDCDRYDRDSWRYDECRDLRRAFFAYEPRVNVRYTIPSTAWYGHRIAYPVAVGHYRYTDPYMIAYPSSWSSVQVRYW
jgi:hypothetical protein